MTVIELDTNKQTINKKNKPNIKPSGIYFKDIVAQAHFQVLYIV